MKLKSKLTKFLIGTVFLIALCISSIQVVFAEQDISMLISQWFDQQKTSAVASMETAIGSEKEQQMIRLKAHLQSEMERAQSELSVFEQQQIAESVEALRLHTNQLIDTVSYSNAADEQAIIDELNFIFNSAILAMGSVELVEIQPVETDPPTGNNGNPGNNGDGQGEGNDGNNNGQGPGENNGNGNPGNGQGPGSNNGNDNPGNGNGPGPGENNGNDNPGNGQGPGNNNGNDKPGKGKGNSQGSDESRIENSEQTLESETVTEAEQTPALETVVEGE